MNRSKWAYVFDIHGIAELTNLKPESPVIDKLIFIDTAPTKRVPRRQFPCYITDVIKDKEGVAKALDVAIVQWIDGGPQIVKVRIGMETIKSGKKVLFWSMPPESNIAEILHPFPEAEQVGSEKKDPKKEGEQA